MKDPFEKKPFDQSTKALFTRQDAYEERSFKSSLDPNRRHSTNH